MFYGKPSVFDSAEMTIDIVQNGAIATGDVYPQPFKTGVLWDAYLIKAIHWHDSQETLLYFSTAIRKTIKEKFSYDKKATWDRVKEEYMYLPVTKQKNIDFVFIEEFVRELEEERMRELEAYLSEAGLDDCTLTDAEKKALRMTESGQKKMRQFSVVEKFSVSNSHNILKSDVLFGSGTTPYVTASEGNNSIVSYIAYDPEMMERGNTIMIGGKTLVITYQPYDFFSNDSHNLVLTIKEEQGRNESAQLYMVAALYKTLGPKYSWGDSISKKKIQNDVVYLPVTSDGNSIDYGFMTTYISAVKKLCIARLKQEIEQKWKAYNQVTGNHAGKVKAIELNKIDSYYSEADFEPLMAAEPFECYKWEGFDQSICDFFGGDKTILIGCYKGKKYKDWIRTHNIYTIRLGDTKGSMEANRELFDSTSLLVLYELGKPNKLSTYKIVGNKEMGKEELLAIDYPNKKPRKSYMAFSITPLEMDLTSLVKHHLVERLIELNSENAKGTPVFIQP